MEKRKFLLLAIAGLLLVGCGSITQGGGEVDPSANTSQTSVSSVVNNSNTTSGSSVTQNSSAPGSTSSVSVSVPPVIDSYQGTYYNSISATMTGNELKTALQKIITETHNAKGYDALWTAYRTTDVYPGTDKIWDIYSNYRYTVGKDQAGNYSDEGDAYNREHSIPQSWFGKASPMVSDVHHIYPTDGKVNGMRSNYPYGEVGSASYTSKNGSKLGSSSFKGYSGKVFEPVDEYKGDLARTYFYFATRYPGRALSGEGSVSFSNSFPHLTKYALDLFIKWHEQDPVSQKEIDRNNAAAKFQGNRNPFIDHPSYVAKIFGTRNAQPVNPNPTTSSSSSSAKPLTYTVVDMPQVNVTYKLGLYQKNLNADIFFNGSESSNGYYLQTTQAIEEAVDVKLVNAVGGYYLTFAAPGAGTKYINLKTSERNENLYYNPSIGNSGTTIWNYNNTYKTLVGTIIGTEIYLGSYNEFDTIGGSKTSYLGGSGNFQTHFYQVG